MSVSTALAPDSSELARKKGLAVAVRERARGLFRDGRSGIQIAESLGESARNLVLGFLEDALDRVPEGRRRLAGSAAVVAVGGTGRGDMAPFSDVDLLFLESGGGPDEFRNCAADIVQSCWDAKLDLGHSIRSVGDCVALARQDAEIATSLIEARLLWGSRDLFDSLQRQFRRKVVEARRRAFVEDCLAARAADWPEPGVPALELQPNVKRSLGGLRDLHLLRWLGFALFDAKEIDALRLKGAITRSEAGQLRAAREFLWRIRIDLHLASGRAQDVLNFDEQLRLAAERGFASDARQRAVEKFMQEYFGHSAALAAIARRFVERHQPRPLLRQIRSGVLSHRADGVLRVSGERVDVAPRHLASVCGSPESVLRLYKTAALYGVLPTARLVDSIRDAVGGFGEDLSNEAAGLFLDILECTSQLGPVLRSMYDAGVLEFVIPQMRHARCLMQFNQYHHYTVDEHTLRALDTVGEFANGSGPLASAYKSVRRKRLLHLALLLHDLGKGFDEPHSDVGRRIALQVADRLGLEPQQRDQLVFLVHRHLMMSHYALRRDITDPELLVQFSREVGTPETLRMLYVLTAADIMAVGPGAWTGWKEQLLTELFDRAMVILSGRHYGSHERETLEQVKRQVTELVGPSRPDLGFDELRRWIDRQLAGFSAYYLTCTPPERIAADLEVIGRLGERDIHIAGRYDTDTGTVDYRVITRDPDAVAGCFHRMVGVLTACRTDILAADINTTQDGVVVDNFRVTDRDFDADVPDSRVVEVTDALRRVLRGEMDVESLFVRKTSRFTAKSAPAGLSELPRRVVVDNDSSDSRTVIDVFAYDRRGLLYVLARGLHDLGISVDLAKIATHYDQVVDVFYIRESDGSKLTDERVGEVRDSLIARLDEFEGDGDRAFNGG